MLKKPSEIRRLERIVKGFANRHRLEILVLLASDPGLSVDEIAGRLRMGYLNASDHIRKMETAGLLFKRNDGRSVRHQLTPRAVYILSFCKNMK